VAGVRRFDFDRGLAPYATNDAADHTRWCVFVCMPAAVAFRTVVVMGWAWAYRFRGCREAARGQLRGSPMRLGAS
jgi:hypothetical protein